MPETGEWTFRNATGACCPTAAMQGQQAQTVPQSRSGSPPAHVLQNLLRRIAVKSSLSSAKPFIQKLRLNPVVLWLADRVSSTAL